ncbi:hypothetical protein H2248_011003 [Termitomyces sp. 'cryptogamus']|nr:hypothetical protein H2248_011003 [Termitomyces sp. 'cryptogamus']
MISVYQDWTAQSSYRLIVWALIPRLSSLYIIAFPVLNHYWSAQPIRESLNNIAPSLKDHDDFVPDQLSNVVLVVNSITEQTLIDNIKSLNESFPAIKHLQLEVEKAESYQPPTVLYTALSLLPRLTVLTFCLLEGKLLASRYVSLESELQLADLWTKSSPELREIFFLSGNTLVRDKESRIWRLHSQAAAESEEE